MARLISLEAQHYITYYDFERPSLGRDGCAIFKANSGQNVYCVSRKDSCSMSLLVSYHAIRVLSLSLQSFMNHLLPFADHRLQGHRSKKCRLGGPFKNNVNVSNSAQLTTQVSALAAEMSLKNEPKTKDLNLSSQPNLRKVKLFRNFRLAFKLKTKFRSSSITN